MPTVRRFAEGTTVEPQRSRDEIERLLRLHGADQFIAAWEADKGAVIAFRLKGRQIRFRIVYPPLSEFLYDRSKRWRPERSRTPARSAEIRRMWRARLLILKAKLEAIASGDATVDSEFLSWIQLPDGGSVGEWLEPQLDTIYESGQMPALAPGLQAAQRALPEGRR